MLTRLDDIITLLGLHINATAYIYTI